jgi:ATP-binding cassette subfamily F protein uup
MAWLRLRNVSFSYGGANVLEDVSLQIQPGERIGLLGRNGAGKSTLLKLLQGQLQPDQGEIERAPGMVLARLVQDVPSGGDHTVFDEVSAWKLERQIETTISRMGLDAAAPFETLASGLKRRVLLAQTIVSNPDFLLLDEPTNHLDIESINWLEDFLLRDARTLVFVTHDRVFLQRLATRIIEVERARLFDWTCDYTTFLARKEAALEAEAHQETLFDKKLAQEEVWVRQGVKARRTRNEGRVRALERLREERRARRTQMGNVRLQVQDSLRSGNIVIAAEGISHSFGGPPVLEEITTTIYRGDKIGILGPNGCGKTTLLRILLGELPPQRGTVRLGTNLQVAYFDQLRAQLDEDKSAVENVAEGSETVLINDRPRHVLGYLHDFLFSGERARSLVRYLSGGERNRLLLARMFTRPANLLVLDEPTNDLDAETLELLESLLVDFPGTILLVSHDRAFLNNVATSTFVFEGAGRFKDYVGGYDDWLGQRSTEPVSLPDATAKPEPVRPARGRQRKLSYKEERELDALPQLIETLETEQTQLHRKMAEPAFYRQAGPEISKVTDRLEVLQRQLQSAYSRWETLLKSKG